MEELLRMGRGRVKFVILWHRRLWFKSWEVCEDKIGVGVESSKIAFLGGTSYSLVHTLAVSFNHSARVTDRQTDRQTTVSCQ